MNKQRIFTILCVLFFGLSFCISGCGSLTSDTKESKNQITAKTESSNSTELPEIYTDSFITADDNVTGEIKADVTYPDSAMPVLRVQPKEVTVAEVKQWADILFEKNIAYEPKRIRTKQEIEERIDQLEESMEDKEVFYAEKGDVWSYYEDMIAALEADYKTAPETCEKKETDWTFHNAGYYDIDATQSAMDSNWSIYNKTMSLNIETDKKALDGYQGYITAHNRDADDYIIHSLNFWYKDETDILKLPESDITYDEALAMANEMKAKLGFEDWQLFEDFGENDRYFFRYAPVYQGIPAFAAVGIDITSEEEYAAHYYYETLEIDVTRGRILGVSWNAPLKVIDEEVSDAMTLDFNRIVKIFKDYMATDYKDNRIGFETEYKAPVKIIVDDIFCQLIRVKIKDESDDFYMVPTWAFSGRAESEDMKMTLGVLVTINGITGEIINSEVGY